MLLYLTKRFLKKAHELNMPEAIGKVIRDLLNGKPSEPLTEEEIEYGRKLAEKLKEESEHNLFLFHTAREDVHQLCSWIIL